MSEFIDRVQIPLENVEYTIEQYLLAHGAMLDTQTRFLLAGVRDCVGRVAGSTRRITTQTGVQRPAADQRQGRLELIR